MKKIISIIALFVIVLGNISISLAAIDCSTQEDELSNMQQNMKDCKTLCMANNNTCKMVCQSTWGDKISTAQQAFDTCIFNQESSVTPSASDCDTMTETWDTITKKCTPITTNSPTTTNNGTTLPPDQTVNGITIGQKCLLNGQCKFNIYDTLNIRTSVRDKNEATSVGLFVQDIVLSATFFIGTVVTIALIVSGLMFIFAAASGKDPSAAKKGITGSLIGLVIVACSYLIIRLVQYLAKGF